MALPSKLKNFNLFNNGNNYLGLVSEITLPKLSRKVEEWRGGGMDTSVEVDVGGEIITLEWTAGGLLQSALAQFGATTADAVPLRFSGAYQRADDGTVDAVDVIVRGVHKEIDFGTAKPGDATAHKYTTTCSYYRLDINGTTVIEIDALAMVFSVNGVDRLAEQRRALGV